MLVTTGMGAVKVTDGNVKVVAAANRMSEFTALP
jgi:hypothetical protein